MARPAAADPSSPSDSWVATENQLPGDTGWNVSPAEYADDDSLVGYATHSSVAPGEPITLRINNTMSDSETVRAYRIGYYAGTGGRLVATQGPIAAQAQPRTDRTATNPLGAHLVPTDDAGRTVNTVDAADWNDSTVLDTTGWPEGAYLLVLDAGNGKKSQIPVIVHSTTFTDRTALVSAPSTWQAYNHWGGYSAYNGLCSDGVNSGNCRSRVVSFQRPLDQNGGVDHFMVMERAAIVEAEKTGVDLAYTTTMDLSSGGPDAFTEARALVELGHDEYWSNGQLATETALRDRGTNLVFTGGNSLWWRIRYDNDASGRPAGMQIWKSPAEDPVKDYGNASINFPDTTTLATLGSRYQCYGVNGTLHVTDANFFLFNGTGAINGSEYPGILREEVDGAYNSTEEPKNLQIAAHSPFYCPSAKVNRTADLSYYSVGSGAGVLNLASMGWVMAMDPLHYDRHPFTATSIAFATDVFDNAIIYASAGRLGDMYPPQPNVSTVIPKPVAPTKPISNPSDPGFPSTVTKGGVATKGTGAAGDLSGDRLADLLTVDAKTGDQNLSVTTAGPALKAPEQVGTNWAGMNWMGLVPDLSGEGWPELLARRIDGSLWLYPGLGKGLWGVPTRVGTGWGSMTSLTVSPDISGDHKPDLLARTADGRLVRYGFTTATSGLTGGVAVGKGWQGMLSIVAVNDLSGDGKPDVMALRTDGRMYLYSVAGGRLASLGEKGHGWLGFRQVLSPGDMDGDGRWDLVGLRSDGNVYEYRNLGKAWGPARQIARGWSNVRLLA